MQLATDYLGYFALANHLHDPFSAALSARIVSVSSSTSFYSPIIFEDIHLERPPYDPWAAEPLTRATPLQQSVYGKHLDRCFLTNTSRISHKQETLHRPLAPSLPTMPFPKWSNKMSTAATLKQQSTG